MKATCGPKSKTSGFGEPVPEIAGVPMDVIKMQDYGMMRGDKVLAAASWASRSCSLASFNELSASANFPSLAC